MSAIAFPSSVPPSVLAPDNYSYKERALRAPEVAPDEEIIFDEPGRVLGRPDVRGSGGVCCRSHYFRVTKPQFGFYTLKVRHGGGDQSWKLDYDRRTIEALAALDSDARFRLLWVIAAAHGESWRAGKAHSDSYWHKAAIEKRIRVRKTPSGHLVMVKPAAIGGVP